MNFALDKFISIDIETTGLDPAIDKITEIGAVKYENGLKVDSYSQLVNPGVPIPPDIIELTGIDDDMVADAPIIEAAIGGFEEFIGDYPLLVGQNVRFDISFLKLHMSPKYIAELDNSFIDTAALSRLVWPGLKSYGQAALAENLNIPVEIAHRALADAEVCAQVYLYELAALKELPQKIKNFAAGILFGITGRSGVLSSLEILSDNLPKPKAYSYDYGDNVIGESSIEPVDEYRLIDVDTINEVFETNLRGVLDDYEERPQQIKMAAGVAGAFNNTEILIAEAPTGIGKSLAYLVPTLIWAKTNGDSILISTQTKNLQDQLFGKDIPLVRQALDFDFKAVLLKGRGNYLCLFKYYELLSEAINSYGINERLGVMALIVWAETTKTGDIAECTGFYPGRFRYLWSRASCEGNFCLGRACGYYKKCFLVRVKNEATTAHIKVINHYLLFADFASGGELLQSSGQAILDEAHNLEKVAASYLGPELNYNQCITAFNQVFTIRPIEAGFLALVKTKLGDTNEDEKAGFEAAISKIQRNLLKARGKFSEFFEKLAGSIAKRNAGCYESNEIRYRNLTQYVSQDLIDDCVLVLKHIESMLKDLADEIDLTDSVKDKSELAIRGRAIALDLHEMRDAFDFLTYPDEANYVYWVELNQKRDARLVSAPLDVGKIFDEKFYDHLKTLVLSSATLSVARDFSYYRKRLGLNLKAADRVAELTLDSPFDLKKNVGFYEAAYLPEPNTKQFDKQAAETILGLFDVARVRGMVLFTSYRSITSVLDTIGSRLIDKGFELFVQNSDLSPFQLLSRYRKSPRGIIFGTDSFWEGVDLPGEELELLVIAKLPFSVPDRPWIKANLEKIENEGGNPFMEFSLPEAVIKFRQGFGRLIRKKNDRGCIISLDSRLSGKRYGWLFVNSVQPVLKVCPTLNSLVNSTAKFFKS